MNLTFGQYRILLATRYSLNEMQLSEQTHFDKTLVNYIITGLLSNGLVTAIGIESSGNPNYELTESGLLCLEAYERANPDLIIGRTTDE